MSPLKVMIVEDEVIAALATQKMLQRLGYEVCGNVTTGEEALKVLDEQCPDLVVMDVCLDGELDGIETTARMKSHRDVPVIYVTAYSDDSTRARAETTRPLAYLIKPLDMNLLTQALAGLSRPTADT